MENCKHSISVKQEGNMLITICTKCGQILDTKTINENKSTTNTNCNGGCQSKGGIILHD